MVVGGGFISPPYFRVILEKIMKIMKIKLRKILLEGNMIKHSINPYRPGKTKVNPNAESKRIEHNKLNTNPTKAETASHNEVSQDANFKQGVHPKDLQHAPTKDHGRIPVYKTVDTVSKDYK